MNPTPSSGAVSALAAALAAALAMSLPAPLAAQGAWSRAYDHPGFGIGGRVFHLGTFRNELIAGTYRSPRRDGNRLNHVARFDGVRWHPLGSGVDGQVRCSLEFQGQLFVGGLFTTAGGGNASNIARWNGSNWQPAGAGFDGEVWALAEHQGQLYAGGEFTASGGVAVGAIARWTGTAWQPVAGGLSWGLGGSASVQALLSDGALLYAGGEFDRAGSTPASHIAAFDGSSWRPLGTGINNFGWGWVRALARHNNRIYVGGAFGQAGAVLSDNIAAWDGSTWHAVGAGLQGGSYGAIVWDLEVYNGSLYVGGSFVQSNGTPLERVARFDGTALQPTGGVDAAEVNPPSVMAMQAWNGRLYCGGEFKFAGMNPASPQGTAVFHVAAFDGAAWSQVGDGFGIDDQVRTIGRYQGSVLAGGPFRGAGTAVAFGLARFGRDGWQPFGTFDGAVHGTLEHNGELWVAGEFATVNGIPCNGVARFDGAAWNAVGSGPSGYGARAIALYQGMVHVGTVGSPRRWNGTTWEAFAQVTGTIRALHVHNGALFLGGSTPFHPGAPNLFAWDGSQLTVPGGGVDGDVDSLGSWNGELVVGGRFQLAGSIAARCLARWNGASWSTFGGVGVRGTTVLAITTFQGALVIGGDFSRFQGENADYVARWDGARWQPIGASAPNGAAFALLADDARGELHVGGWYSENGSQQDAHYSLWQTTPSWTDVGQGIGSPRRTPVLTGDGTLLAGGRTRWRLSSALENAPAVFVLGFQRIDQPLFGGTLIPRPDALVFGGTDAIGTMALQATWPGLANLQLFAQAFVVDAAAGSGITASNAVWLRTP